MKVAVSIPDPVFERAEQLAARMNLSRSGIYAKALDEFVARHDAAWDVDAINAAIDAIGLDAMREESEPITGAGSRTVLKHTQW